MSKVVNFVPKSERDGRKNLEDFIRFCRDELILYDWGDWKWVSSGVGKSAITFTRYRKVSNPYPSGADIMREPFLSAVKAFVRYKQSIQETTSIGNFQLQAIRLVHDGLEIMNPGAAPDLLSLDGAVQLKVSELLTERYKEPATRNKIGNALVSFYKFIREKGFIPALPVWRNPHPRQAAKAQQTSKEALRWQDERRLPLEVVIALGEVFARAEEPRDLYWSSIFVLLLFAPNRVGELQSLTVDCLLEADGHLYVRWWGKKGFGPTLKKVPKVMEPAVRLAVERLLQVGAPARHAAEYAYTNLGRFYRHDGCIGSTTKPDDVPLDAHEVAAAMGNRNSFEFGANTKTAWSVLNGRWLEDAKNEEGVVTYDGLARSALKRYSPNGWEGNGEESPTAGDTSRPIWDALCLRLDRQFHKEFQPVPFSWVEVNANDANNELSGKMKSCGTRDESIFERFGLKDEDGAPIRLTTHQIRTWLSTVAERAGMDDYTLAVWAARADPRHNEHYDLRTSDERNATKIALVGDDLTPPQSTSLAKLSKAPTAIELIRMGQTVAVAHLGKQGVGPAQATLYGWCTADWAQSPCFKSHQCVICKELRCVKGDEVKLENLRKHVQFLEVQMSKAQEAFEREEYGADEWLKRYRSDHAQASKTIQKLSWELAHAKTFVAVMEDPSVPDGSIIAIPAGHDVDPAVRALLAKDKDVKRPQIDESPQASILSMIGVSRVEN
jgi:hypothetical protein